MHLARGNNASGVGAHGIGVPGVVAPGVGAPDVGAPLAGLPGSADSLWPSLSAHPEPAKAHAQTDVTRQHMQAQRHKHAGMGARVSRRGELTMTSARSTLQI